jgi:hypothetical protein
MSYVSQLPLAMTAIGWLVSPIPAVVPSKIDNTGYLLQDKMKMCSR